MTNYMIRPSECLSGRVNVPGDKSITHRAFILSALAEGASRVTGYLDGGDCQATLQCLGQLGVVIESPAPGTIIFQGQGLHGLREPDDVLDCQRSGTTMRLMAGVLAGLPLYSVLTGDDQLRRRPMGRIISPLTDMGAAVMGRDHSRLPPLSILGGHLKGTEHELSVASAQVKSCLLLAGLFARGRTTVVEPGPSRDHTERMLHARGVDVQSRELKHVLKGPVERLEPLDVQVPGDFSSAAYLVVAALLTQDSDLLIKDVGINPTRTGLLDALVSMGADIALEEGRDEGGEPVASLRVRSSSLHGTNVNGSLVPRTIDEFPVLALAATQAQGETRIRDAAELRVKETDRIATTVTALRALGAEIDAVPDGFDILGPTPLQGAQVDSHGDHRVAMTIAVAGLVAEGTTTVHRAECIADSFPGFRETLSSLGVEIAVEESTE